MIILGYIGAIMIGLILGLIGGGGSILTVPVLVYLMGVSPLLATSYSLFVVGSSSLVGALRSAKIKQVDFKAVLLFGLPAIASVLFTRAYVLPNLPEVLFTVGSFAINKNLAVMLLFAILMVASSVFMIKRPKLKPQAGEPTKTKYTLLLLVGFLVGFLTGLLGAGGGFLIIPALVLLAKLPMKTAIGTSLAIIAINSFIGFTADLNHFTIDWVFILPFTLLAIAGIFIGGRLARNIPGPKLKPAFGWFVLVMGIFILAKELM